MCIDSKTNRFILEIIDLIKMPQNRITDQEKVRARALELVLVNGELALVTLCLMKVELGLQLDYLSTDLNANGREGRGDLVTRSHDLTEVVISHTVQV